jgi:hypothetical protein
MRLRQTLLVAASVVAIVMVAALVALSQAGTSQALPVAANISEQEPNNSFDEAQSVSLGDTVFSGAANQPITDTDFFAINTTTGLSYRTEFQTSSNEGLFLKLLIYDRNFAYLTSSSSSKTSANISWTAYGDKYFIEVQPSGPVTTTLLETDYALDLLQIAATPTATPKPTSTPTPKPTTTIIPGADRFEPNHDFDHASTLGTDITYKANFITHDGRGEDNDFYKVWVKPGIHFECETLDLAPGVDTNMIVYDASRNGLGGNDDIELGSYASRFAYFSTYEGWLYVLVGHGGRLPAADLANSEYSIRCNKSVPGQATPTRTPEPTHTPRPDATRTPPSSPLSTPPAGDNLKVRVLTTPTPIAQAGEPSRPRFLPVTILVYYDGNRDQQPGAGEGVAGISVQALEVSTGKLLTQGYTDDQGSLEFTVSAQGQVQVKIPFFGFSQLVAGDEGASLYLRIPPTGPQETL